MKMRFKTILTLSDVLKQKIVYALMEYLIN
jgi:hypothetical protein